MIEFGTLETEVLSWKYLDGVNSKLLGWGLQLPKHDYPSEFNKPFVLARKSFGYGDYPAILEAYANGDGSGFYITLIYQRSMEENFRVKKLSEIFDPYIKELTGTKIKKV